MKSFRFFAASLMVLVLAGTSLTAAAEAPLANAVQRRDANGVRELLAKRIADPRLLDRVAVQFGEVLGHALSRRVVPGAVADPVARVHGAGALRAEIRVPRDAAAPCGRPQRLAIRVSTGQPAKVRTVALADRRDEERHRLRLRRRLLCRGLLCRRLLRTDACRE